MVIFTVCGQNPCSQIEIGKACLAVEYGMVHKSNTSIENQVDQDQNNMARDYARPGRKLYMRQNAPGRYRYSTVGVASQQDGKRDLPSSPEAHS
jgi:hypothetical protein